MKNILIFLTVVILLAYILLYINQRNLLYFPTKSNSNIIKMIEKQYTNSKISLNVEKDIKINGYYIDKNSETTFIYFGGNAENIEYFIKDSSYFFNGNVISFYYRGYGLSNGDISEEKAFNDALVIYDFLVKEKKIKNIIVIGRSLGTGVATYLAYKRDVKKVILISPYDSILNIAQERFFFIPSFMIKDKFESEKYAKNINSPLLAIYATDDKVVTKEHSIKLIKSWKGKVTSLSKKGYNHGTIMLDNDVWKSIDEFLK